MTVLIRRCLLALCAAMLGLYAGFACAQVVYKSTMPDGHVVYGNAPAPGAKKVEPMEPRTGDTGARATVPEQEQALRDRQSDREKQDAQQSKIVELEKALKEAEAAQAAGHEPTEGERTTTVNGTSKLNEAYWKRQQELQEAVEEARTRLAQARGAAR